MGVVVDRDDIPTEPKPVSRKVRPGKHPTVLCKIGEHQMCKNARARARLRRAKQADCSCECHIGANKRRGKG